MYKKEKMQVTKRLLHFGANYLKLAAMFNNSEVPITSRNVKF